MPVARHKARAPAMLRPAVDVLERYSGISYLQWITRYRLQRANKNFRISVYFGFLFLGFGQRFG